MRHGVAYLGEAARLRFAAHRKASLDRQDLERILRDNELSFGIDPVALGWKPPYWDDEEWRTVLSASLTEAKICAASIGGYERSGLRCIGQLLRSLDGVYGSSFSWMQSNIPRESFDFLRAGMIVPADWQPVNAKRRATSFETEHDCLRAVEAALAAHTNLSEEDRGSIADMLTAVVRFVGVKELGEVAHTLADKLPFIEPYDDAP